MRKAVGVFLSLIILVSLVPSVNANENQRIIMYSETVLEDGTIVIEQVLEVSSARSTDKTYIRKKAFVQDGTTIGIIAITATFRYDGTTVSVISKSVSQTDTYDGWSYKQNSFTSSGGTVTLDAKLTKLLLLNVSFAMTLSCDKDGNISYT